MTLEAVIFDMDELLLDTERIARRTFLAARRPTGLRVLLHPLAGDRLGLGDLFGPQVLVPPRLHKTIGFVDLLLVHICEGAIPVRLGPLVT